MRNVGKNTRSGLIISKAAESHRPAIMSLLKQVNMHYIPSKEMPELTYDNYFVAKLKNRVVGFCGYKIIAPGKAKTELMAVDSEHRGMGIGYSLQVRRMEDMKIKGVRTLVTNSDLPETINWYKKHFGYVEAGKVKKLHEFGDPAISHWTVLNLDLQKWESNGESMR